ncbi:MAG: hypothetical protein WAX69_12295 [Victivallales bacterium]
MANCQPIGPLIRSLILDLYRRLPPVEQDEYLESLKACVKIEEYRKKGLILRGSDIRCLKKAGMIRTKSPGEGKRKDNAV